jgi:DNA-3-methyladenine glycosylase
LLASSRFPWRRLPRAFYARPTAEVARDLIGKLVVHETTEGPRTARLVETEAYLGTDDLASHARFGPTRRSRIMFGPPGFAYVYLIYGMHHCLNVVTETDGQAGAVLLRAASPWPEPARVDDSGGGTARPAHRPFRGPGKLCAALGVTLRHNGLDLETSELYVAELREGASHPPLVINTSARVGVAYAGSWAARPLRFFLAGDPHVSAGASARRQSSSTVSVPAPSSPARKRRTERP